MITKKLSKKVAVKKAAVKKITFFKPLVLSRHPSHDLLRTSLARHRFHSVVRLGSETIPERNNERVQINTPQAVRNSANKLLMKQCFTRAGVKTAQWFTKSNDWNSLFNESNSGLYSTIDQLPYPIIAKSLHGSRGEGNFKLDNQAALEAWMRDKNLSGYIFEKFMTYSREYRLHVTKDGCFYTCRKLLRNDAPANTWQRHDDVCSWALETNPSFKKPNNWDAIVQDCINAQRALGLDICAFDVMVQGSREGRERTNPEWIICESCSAPSFGEITGQKYIQEINRLIVDKYNNR